MNSALIEEITRQVIEKLLENETEIALSNDEIDDWNRISQVINNDSVTNNSGPISSQLTETEISEWLQISSTFTVSENESGSENEVVKIKSYT